MKLMNIHRETLTRTIQRFGQKNQMEKAAEECMELARAIDDYLGGKTDKEAYFHVVEEIADVLIVIQQLMIFFTTSEHVQDAIFEKVRRLRDRLDSNYYENNKN